MRFFFYGTLMDRGLLAAVLRRRVGAAALRPASIFGYRRSGVERAGYPIILRSRGGRVGGVVFERAARADRRRLSCDEGSGYRVARAVAAVPGEARKIVLVFVPKPGAFAPTGKPWSYARWRRRAQRAALLAVLGRR
jgi:Gamma-glutamyl cyclotransferase, AIG2-like